MAADTPKRWGEYLDHLEVEYQKELAKWEKERRKIVRENKTRTFWQRVWQSNANRLQEHKWRRPWKRSPEVLDYYAWDVETKPVKSSRN